MKYLFTLLLTATAALAAEPPVAFPDLQHFAPLWERSIFTTRDLPSPDAPVGPIFTDSLSLAGIYEVDGQVVAVIVDRTTSQIHEARIGSENESGIKIRKVQPGASMDKTRIQLQKGDQAGWVGFADAAPAETVAPAITGQQQAQQPATPVAPQSLASPLLPALNQAPTMPPPAAPVSPPVGSAEVPGDVPLPPP
ncbi:MAG: hypothetical protein NTV80_07340 [Verrucomicrobia bacterium]|nr:hypothetical protein [Verrucomicrobiota bacterium]